ncbi:MAG: heme-binding protein [Cohaesibacter sp.]|jgi:uncharacterized protein GlcG (DUF336 family)|nr:heme-binding protein [Cohaesibacter sp.]
MSALTLKIANQMIEAAIAKGHEMSLNPLTVAVLDAGGHLKAFAREDNTSIMRPQIAQGKAYGALAVGFGTRWLNTNAQDRPHFVQALNGASGGAIIPVPGGVLIKDKDGNTLGAIGITGDTSDNDEAAALAGIAAVGLEANTGA